MAASRSLNEPVVMTTLVKGWAAWEDGTTLAAHRSEAATLATNAFIWHLRVPETREIVARRQGVKGPLENFKCG
jgi:hypothetical protein